MISTLYKVGTAVSSGALLLASMGPLAHGAQSITITGNGSDSTNSGAITTINTTFVTQNNDADVDNDVDLDLDTGNNSASDNTGGDVNLKSGDIDADVKVVTVANSNVAEVENCNGCLDDVEIKIAGNGTYSDNTANVTSLNTVFIDQDNDLDVDNDVDIDADTGDNDADDNTGGDVELTSGDIDADVELFTAGNHNVAVVGSGSGHGQGGIDIEVSGNGSDTVNTVNVDLLNTIFVEQDNDLDVDNDVDLDLDTGYNSASDNTGGEVNLTSGDIDSGVKVKTLGNFNVADLEVCCFEDLEAKIAGNGTDSTSYINVLLDNFLLVDQDNDADVDNDVDVDGDTGDNDVDDNTNHEGDPSLTSGGIDSSVGLFTTTNSNVMGSTDLPDVGDDDFWSGLWDWVWLH